MFFQVDIRLDLLSYIPLSHLVFSSGIKFILPLLNRATNPIVRNLAVALYSVITGTVAIGMWVTAHEAGHGAFSDNRKLQDFIGYLFHSVLLVPYYSWQR